MISPARWAKQWPWVMVVLVLLACWQASCGQSGAERRGRELFESNCAPCHEAAKLDLKKQPPKLEGLFQSKALPSGAPATDEQLRKVIIQGIGTMPAFDQRLSQEDVDDLLQFLHQLK
jgi:mono/diheme cytochrome c family protein